MRCRWIGLVAVAVALCLAHPCLSEVDAGNLTIGVDRSLSYSSPTRVLSTAGGCSYYCPGPGTEVHEGWWDGNELYAHVEIRAGTEYRADNPCQDNEVTAGGAVVVHAVAGPNGEQEMDAYVRMVYSYSLSRDTSFVPPPGSNEFGTAYCRGGIYERLTEPTSSVSDPPVLARGWAVSPMAVRTIGGASNNLKHVRDIVVSSEIRSFKAGWDYRFLYWVVAKLCEETNRRVEWAWATARLAVHSITITFLTPDAQYPELNLPPIAVAGVEVDGEIHVGEADVATGGHIQLDGTKSLDAEEPQLAYTWTLVEQPGAGASLSDATAARPMLHIANYGLHRLHLTVSDGVHTSAISELRLYALPECGASGLQRGDLIFYRYDEGGLPVLAWLLDFTHVGIYLGQGRIVEAHKGRGGVVISDVAAFFDMDHISRIKVVRVKNATQLETEAAIDFAMSKLGSEYQWQFINRSLGDAGAYADSWYCSELAWASFVHGAGIDLGELPPVGAISPDDILTYADELEQLEPVDSCDVRQDSPPSGLAFVQECPVELRVTDPLGRVVELGDLGISNTFYAKFDLDGDGEPDSAIGIPEEEIVSGVYRIEVIPHDGADPGAMFDLSVICEGEVTVIASSLRIDEIPAAPFEFTIGPKAGDVDGDGVVDALDVRLAFQLAVGAMTLPLDERTRADVDNDGDVDMDDVRMLAEYVIGVRDTLP